jgi:hypothetical protein
MNVVKILLAFATGYLTGNIWNPQTYQAGFLDAFKSAPTKECRLGILQNYANTIFRDIK